MNREEIEDFLGACPNLYHVAKRGAWQSIRKEGFLSVSSLLTKYGYDGARRVPYENQCREKGISLRCAGLPDVWLRDQYPMREKLLSKVLEPPLSPSEWYRTINAKVFFWVDRKRAENLSNCYSHQENEMIVLDTRRVVETYEKSILLSPINSGAVQPAYAKRGLETFRTIRDYDWLRSDLKSRPQKTKRVVEFCVEDALPEPERFVLSVDVI